MDTTNAGIPSNNAQLSGDATRVAAINRLKKLEQKGVGRNNIGKTAAPLAGGPPATYLGPPKS
jgi:hypothetical protein